MSSLNIENNSINAIDNLDTTTTLNNNLDNINNLNNEVMYYDYPVNKNDIIREINEEEEDLDYHTSRNEGYWAIAKYLCRVSYAMFDTNYLSDEIDNIIHYDCMIDESRDTETNLDYIKSYEYNYRNIKKVVIDYTLNDNDIDSYIFDNSECHYILENLKIPNYNKKRTLSYMNYFKSFIFNNVIPSSHHLSYDDKLLKFTNIWVHHEKYVINFYNDDNGNFKYNYVNI